MYQTRHQGKGKAKARVMPLRIALRRSAAPKTRDRRIRATTTRREARREAAAAAGRCSSSGLPRSGSSTPMESSPTHSSSSSSSLSPPPSPPDRQGRLSTTQLEQLRVEQEVFGIYRLFHGVAPHTRRFRPLPLAIGRYQSDYGRATTKEEEATREKEEERKRGRTSMRLDPASPSLDDPDPVGNSEAMARLLLRQRPQRRLYRMLQMRRSLNDGASSSSPCLRR
ncbi:hypothetical protein B296_00002902 [Ensete ventricosum]|uniref:Uncharacterized protein n=1 Tax=Ensete ventricosum TaxID=4639 RepID=A0A427B2F2_ENSVE|nr:hypothetical protein B296_00002902 [Ensete ventricosum]